RHETARRFDGGANNPPSARRTPIPASEKGGPEYVSIDALEGGCCWSFMYFCIHITRRAAPTGGHEHNRRTLSVSSTVQVLRRINFKLLGVPPDERHWHLPAMLLRAAR